MCVWGGEGQKELYKPYSSLKLPCIVGTQAIFVVPLKTPLEWQGQDRSQTTHTLLHTDLQSCPDTPRRASCTIPSCDAVCMLPLVLVSWGRNNTSWLKQKPSWHTHLGWCHSASHPLCATLQNTHSGLQTLCASVSPLNHSASQLFTKAMHSTLLKFKAVP